MAIFRFSWIAPAIISASLGCGCCGTTNKGDAGQIHSAGDSRQSDFDRSFQRGLQVYRDLTKFGRPLDEWGIPVEGTMLSDQYKHAFWLPIEAEPVVEFSEAEPMLAGYSHSGDKTTADFAAKCLAILNSTHRYRRNRIEHLQHSGSPGAFLATYLYD